MMLCRAGFNIAAWVDNDYCWRWTETCVNWAAWQQGKKIELPQIVYFCVCLLRLPIFRGKTFCGFFLLSLQWKTIEKLFFKHMKKLNRIVFAFHYTFESKLCQPHSHVLWKEILMNELQTGVNAGSANVQLFCRLIIEQSFSSANGWWTPSFPYLCWNAATKKTSAASHKSSCVEFELGMKN